MYMCMYLITGGELDAATEMVVAAQTSSPVVGNSAEVRLHTYIHIHIHIHIYIYIRIHMIESLRVLRESR